MRRQVQGIRYAAVALTALLVVSCGGDSAQADVSATTFRFRIQGDAGGQQDFLATTSDPAVIKQVRRQLQLEEGARSQHVNGRIVAATSGGNLGWSWRYADGDWSLAEASIEVCDGTPQQVQQDIRYWLDTVGRFCPWGSYVVAETVESGGAAGIIVKFTTSLDPDALAARVAAMQEIAAERGLTLTYQREGALGAHVLNFGWPIAPADAEQLARAISRAITGIEYAEPDLILYAAN